MAILGSRDNCSGKQIQDRKTLSRLCPTYYAYAPFAGSSASFRRLRIKANFPANRLSRYSIRFGLGVVLARRFLSRFSRSSLGTLSVSRIYLATIATVVNAMVGRGDCQ
jgi:hypothetical protein